MSAPPLDIRGLCVGHGATRVVHDFTLTVQAGEIVSLLGPSGCGKTTTLRAVGGFIAPEAGSVRLAGQDRTAAPPNRRNIGFVFQSYALFPHMTVFDNVAYGLRSRGVSRADITARVTDILSLVQLAPLAHRRPRELSGGQQQRVAIARAVVIAPDVLLLDEPLSNLDARLRHEMRLELRRLLKATQVASIFVTHDQEEAMMLSDRIVLMNAGRIVQEGPPFELYHRPSSLFAASFMGRANFLRGTVIAAAPDGTMRVDIEGHALSGTACGSLKPGDSAILVIKHDRVALVSEGEPGVTCAYEGATFLGAAVQLQCRLGSQVVIGQLTGLPEATPPYAIGEPIRLGWSPLAALVFPGRGSS